MLTITPRSYMFLLTIIVAATVSIFCADSTCEDGWFGKTCSYMCHCESQVACDKVSGACPAACASEWFGPACQYISLELNVPDRAWLTDRDASTCNEDNQSEVAVVLRRPQPLTWMRIVVKNHSIPLRFELKFRVFNQMLNCLNVRIAKIDPKTIDIFCPTIDTATEFILSGPGVKIMCSLYVSGGRNVALKQTAKHMDMDTAWQASNAVDGNPGEPQASDNKSRLVCAATKYAGRYGTWNVTFRRPSTIKKIVIYNWRAPTNVSLEGEETQEYLQGFKLQAFTITTERVFRYKDRSSTAQDVYTIVPSPMLHYPVHTVSLTRGHTSPRLVFCEVVVFGESVCEHGKFGLECDRFCNCATQGDCLVTTGGCPSGCAPGYMGVDCYDLCPVGRYGLNCAKKCSEHCDVSTKECDPIDGGCFFGCAPGYKSPECVDACDGGYYGLGCLKKCPENCWSQMCHHVTGHCTMGCDVGFRGETCDEECADGSFGLHCAKKCSPHCFPTNRTCDAFKGRCIHGCTDEYLPPLCHIQRLRYSKISDATRSSDFLAASVLLAMVIFIIGVIHLGTYLQRSVYIKDNEEDYDEEYELQQAQEVHADENDVSEFPPVENPDWHRPVRPYQEEEHHGSFETLFWDMHLGRHGLERLPSFIESNTAIIENPPHVEPVNSDDLDPPENSLSMSLPQNAGGSAKQYLDVAISPETFVQESTSKPVDQTKSSHHFGHVDGFEDLESERDKSKWKKFKTKVNSLK